MTQPSDRQHLEKLLNIHKKNLQILEGQQAVYGAGGGLLHLINQIEQERNAIAEIEAKLGLKPPTPPGPAPDDGPGEASSGGGAVRNQGKIIHRFNQGCASFQDARAAWKADKISDYENGLNAAASQTISALELALKGHLQSVCQGQVLAPDGRVIDKPNFHDLVRGMETYAQPPLSPELAKRLPGYRELRNQAEHRGTVPPAEEMRAAIEDTRQIILTYLQVEEKQLKRLDGPAAVAEPKSDPSSPPGKTTRSGIPGELFARLRTTLLDCDEFYSPRQLRAVFATEELRPFRGNFPSVDSAAGQVDAAISYLHGKHRATGENALVLFLQILADNYQDQDLQGQLLALARELESK